MAKAVSKKGSPTKAATTKSKPAAKPALLAPAPKAAGKTAPATQAATKSGGKSAAKVTSPAAKIVDVKKTGPIAVKGEKEVKPTAKVEPVAVKPAAVTARPALPPRDLPKNGTSTHNHATTNGELKLKRRKDRREKKPINNPPVPPAPVLSGDARAKKNQAGFTTRELETFRDLLLAKRRELLGDMSSMEREALRTSGSNLSNLPIHMADMGTDNYEQEFTLGIVEKDRGLIREINQALAKIQNGSYGICEGTGKPISKARLEVQPWAKFSIEHARELEKRRGRF